MSNRSGSVNIWRSGLDGSNPQQLTRGSRDESPHCSPDSRWVAYTSNKDAKQRLRRVSIDGGDSVELTNYSSSMPLVSLDGKRIACGYIDEQARRWKAAIIPFEGGAPIRTFDIAMLQTRIQRSRDGKALLYYLTRNGVSNIWSQPVDGGPLKRMTDFKTDQIFRFAISPDGRQLAAVRGSLNSNVILISESK